MNTSASSARIKVNLFTGVLLGFRWGVGPLDADAARLARMLRPFGAMSSGKPPPASLPRDSLQNVQEYAPPAQTARTVRGLVDTSICCKVFFREWSQIGLPGDHHGRAGTAQLGQIAICRHANPQRRALPANDRAIRVRIE